MATHVTPKTAEILAVNWREFDPTTLPGGLAHPLAAELTTYRDRLDEILGHEKDGPFVAIKGREIVGYYRTRRAAINAASARFGPVPILVKQIVEVEPARPLGGRID